jgi:hypothetical protein
MKLPGKKFAPLGEVVAAMFDKAAAFGETPTETARLASLAVMHLWLRTHKAHLPRPTIPAIATAGLSQ